VEACRWLWNTWLAECKQAWEARQETVTYFAQKKALPILKTGERPALVNMQAQVLPDVALRLENACKAYFRRLKAGEHPGYSRFKGRGRYASLTYPQWEHGIKLTAQQKRLGMAKVGDVKIIYHRPLEGTPKTATIRRTATGTWCVTIACEWEPQALPPVNPEVGIDVGLHTFATCADRVALANPRFVRAEEQALATAQRKHQRALDAHNANRAEITKQTTADHPAMRSGRWSGTTLGNMPPGRSATSAARWWHAPMNASRAGVPMSPTNTAAGSSTPAIGLR
jgi:putative transposase